MKHCFFKVSACSPEGKRWQDVEKGFEDLQVLTNELVVVVVQLLLRVPAVAIVGGVRHLHLLGWELKKRYVYADGLLVLN